MFTCQICSKEFRRGDNMRRHVKTVHADAKDNEMIYDKGNPEIIDEDYVSDNTDDDDPNIQDNVETDNSDNDSEAEETAEEEEEGEEEGEGGEEDGEDLDDPWRLLIDEAFEQCQSEFDRRVAKHMTSEGLDEDDARKRVFHNMLPAYRNALANAFVNEMLWFYAMRKNRIYLSVKNTVSDFKLLDSYDNEEAWKAAVNKRKFLFDRILKEYDPPELSEPEDDDDDVRTRTEEQQTVHNNQRGGGSSGPSKVNVNLVSPSEQVALRAKDELLRKGQKRGFDGFTPNDSDEIENMKKPRSTWAPWTVI